VRPTDKGFRRQALAASIAGESVRGESEASGRRALHHSRVRRSRSRAARADRARSYAGIAPAAAHALHMPSHIFVQRGMWEDVRKSNIVAYKSATELNARMKLAEGREDFHTLGWLEYANLMLGNIDEAKANVESAKQAADRNPGNAGIRNGYLGMRARLILETEKVGTHRTRGTGQAPSGTDHAECRAWRCAAVEQHVDVHRRLQRGEAWRSADRGTRRRDAARRARKAEGGANPYSAAGRDHGEAGRALVAIAQGQKDEALKLAKEAMDIELALSAPSGRPTRSSRRRSSTANCCSRPENTRKRLPH
jgi:hypothetical protein